MPKFSGGQVQSGCTLSRAGFVVGSAVQRHHTGNVTVTESQLEHLHSVLHPSMASVSWQTAARDSSLGTATANTLNALYRNVPVTPESPSLPTFIPTATTLVAGGTSPPDRESLEFMRQITSGAQATAVSNFHDSILAGPFSEASNGEFTDIGLWLGSGHYQKGQEKAILGSLGLEEWTRYARGRVRMSNSSEW